jgi:hypothetical protein
MGNDAIAHTGGKEIMIWIKAGLVLIAVAVASTSVTYWLTPKGPEAVVTVQSIRKIAQLATVEYHAATLQDQTFQSSIGLGDVDSSRMIAYYTGAVKGAVDLEKMDLREIVAGVSENGGRGGRVAIHFQRGSIVISGVELVPGEDSMKEITVWRRTGFNPPSDNQREGMRREALQAIRDAAIERGIVDKTKENARLFLSEFVAGFGLTAEITFDENAYDEDADG